MSVLLERQQFVSLGIRVQTDIDLADKNWFQTGGKAQWFAEPETADEFQLLLQKAYVNGWPLFILGQGANILIADQGFNGLVIRPQMNKLSHYDLDANTVILRAEAGVLLSRLITYCLENGFQGLEEFSGIPGTVGGAVFINIHFFEFLLSQFLYKAEVIHKDTGRIEVVEPEWFKFSYNYSILHRQDYFLVSAYLMLKKVSPIESAYNKGRHDEIIRYRGRRYPTSHTCGSFFRNFYPQEVSLVISEKKMIYIAYYLDQLGVKGSLKVGGAMVSHQHANMFINNGTATSEDIIALAYKLQKMVYDKFGIIPQPECRLIGFPSYPLL